MDLRNAAHATDVEFADLIKTMIRLDLLNLANGESWQVVRIPGFKHSENSDLYAFPKCQEPKSHSDLFQVDIEDCFRDMLWNSTEGVPKDVQRKRMIVLSDGTQIKALDYADDFDDATKGVKDLIEKVNRIQGSGSDSDAVVDGNAIRYCGHRVIIRKESITEALIDISYIDAPARLFTFLNLDKEWLYGN